MEKIVKIVAILVLIVSLGFLIFAAKTIDRIQMQKTLMASLQENILSLQNTINTLSKTVDLAKGEITSLRTLAAQLKNDIEKAIADKEKAEAALAEAKNENEKLNTELTEARGRIAILNAQLAAKRQEGGTDITIPAGASLETMVEKLAQKLKETENQLAIAKEHVATLESLGIILERESAVSPGDGTPEIIKEIEGKIVDIKSNGVVAINFKGSIKPQKGNTFYIVDSNQVKAKLALEDVYNTILIANMQIEKFDYSIKDGDTVKLVLWTEE